MEPLTPEEATHEPVLDIREEDTEATAATAATATKLMLWSKDGPSHSIIRFNRPFLMQII